MLQYLEWDSRFFKKRIVNIVCDANYTLDSFKKDLAQFHSAKYECAYIQIDKKNKDLNYFCKQSKISLISIRTEMVNSECKRFSIDTRCITSSIQKMQFKRLFELIHQIAKTSRFYKDKRFRPYALKLYDEWILKTLGNHLLNKCFFAYKRDMLAGILTVKRKDGTLFIDLFGVDTLFRNKGIGTLLIRNAINWTVQNRNKKLCVVTQKENKNAVTFYKKHGFMIGREIYQYHLWN